MPTRKNDAVNGDFGLAAPFSRSLALGDRDSFRQPFDGGTSADGVRGQQAEQSIWRTPVEDNRVRSRCGRDSEASRGITRLGDDGAGPAPAPHLAGWSSPLSLVSDRNPV